MKDDVSLRFGWTIRTAAAQAIIVSPARNAAPEITSLHVVEATAVSSFWGDWLQSLLPWTRVATTLPMARFLYLAWPRVSTVSARLRYSFSVPWMVLIAVLALVLWYWWLGDVPAEWSEILPGLWTLAIGAVMAATGGVAMVKLVGRNLPMPPAGDILVPVERDARYMLGLLRNAAQDLSGRRRRSKAIARVRLEQLSVRVERGTST